MIGINQHMTRKNRRQIAKSFRDCNQRLVYWRSSSMHLRAGGNLHPVATANTRYVTPHYLRQVVPPVNGLSDFSIKYKRLRDGRGIADRQEIARLSLCALPFQGLIRATGTRKGQGFSGCEQRNSWRRSPYLASLQPAAIQPESKPFSVVPRGLAQRFCSMATRLSVLRLGPRATYFIASNTPVNVIKAALRRTSLTKLNIQITGPDSMSAAGDLRYQTPLSKDPICSAKS